MLTQIAIQQLKTDPQGYGTQKSLISPWFVIQNVPDYILKPEHTSENILRRMEALDFAGLLSRFSGTDEHANFSITGNGMQYFRLMIKSMSTIIHDKKSYDNIIDSTEGAKEVKKELKKIHGKLKGKRDEEIVEGYIDLLKRTGPETVSFIVRLLSSIGIGT